MKKKKISRFCKFIPLNGCWVVINTLLRSITLISSDLANEIISGKPLKKDVEEALRSVGVFAPDDKDEIALFEEWLNRIRWDISGIKAVLLLTTRCNFKCPYCFEDGYVKRFKEDMDEEIASSVIRWLKEFAAEGGGEEISLYFYGGEPTLRTDLIEFFVKRVRELEEDGLRLEFNMFTNGSILTPDLLELISSNNFGHLQITLDGPPEVHNRRRPFKSGRGSFDIILSNIKKIADKSEVGIVIVVNFDRENYKSVPQLLDILADEGLKERVELAYNPVFRTNYNTEHCAIFSLPDEETYKIWADLYKITMEKGMKCNPLRIFEKGPCSFWRASHLIFDPWGNIYKCIGFPGVKELRVGNVRDCPPKLYLSKIKDQPEPWRNERCLNCEYLPLCLGGCRFHSFVEYGNIEKPFCHKELIERTEIELIKFISKREVNC